MTSSSHPLTSSLLGELNTLAELYASTISPLQLDRLDIPLNLRAASTDVEMAYAAGRSLCPVFEYSPHNPEADAAVRSLIQRCDELADIPWAQPLRSTLRSYLLLATSAQERTAQSVTLRTSELYGKPRADLLVLARDELVAPAPPPETGELVVDQQVQKTVTYALAAAGLSDWQCSVSPTMSASMDVSAELREIRVRQGELFTSNGIARLLAHEIGVHVFRSASGEHQPLRLLRYGLGNYVTTEEGLACYVEERTGIVDELDYRRIPLRYLAAQLALEADFFSVYKELRAFADHDLAFETVARAKRGMRLTDGPGAHLKDTAYYEGLHLVTAHLDAQPTDLNLLYVGKIAIDLLSLVGFEIEAGRLLAPLKTYDDIAPMLAALDTRQDGEF